MTGKRELGSGCKKVFKGGLIRQGKKCKRRGRFLGEQNEWVFFRLSGDSWRFK